MPINAIKEFLKLEAAGGIILLFALVFILIIANTPLNAVYQHVLDTPFHIGLGPWSLNKPLLLWINDGLMAIFFLVLSLEIKREILAGELSSFAQVVLPCVAAVGGVVVPALIYVAINHADTTAMRGWAIPTATDVALALGLLAMLGKRIPPGLKIFLVVLAIFDDIVAIALIAMFYTSELSVVSLGIAGAGILLLILLNRMKVVRLTPYFIVGIIVWVAVLKSGVHATLAGVALGFCIPFKGKNEDGHSPLKHLEHKLHPWVAFAILPLFVLANAGVSFLNAETSILHPIPLGVAAGLFIGKQIGIFGFSWVVIKLGFANLPRNTSWLQLYGAAILAGIGFTMSLFISGLAFEGTAFEMTSREGILLGSFVSAVVGMLILYFAARKQSSQQL
tara:strand:+ start:7589 stop:8767 length:1179 start_codon:yes stop_codon:yes gene_type:complete